LKRKDFPEIAPLAWAQEVPSSNLGSPTTYFLSPKALFVLILIRKLNCKLATGDKKTPHRCRRGVLQFAQVLREAGYAGRASRPSRTIASNPAVRSVKVPVSGAAVTEAEERSFDTAKPFLRLVACRWR
jgi:hypothetical protein